MSDKKMIDLINSLSLREKAMLCSGNSSWTTFAIPEKNIPSLFMADGPHGVRCVDFENAKENEGFSKKATCFPAQATLACSWDPKLVHQIGAGIAQECLHFGVGMILGPGINIKRSPLGGRNFEYYSEDPLLSGRLAASFINGAQSKNVACCLKHFAVNNQETNRMAVNAAVDERALFDLYLKAFEIAVKEATPASVMASYNKINGKYACENRRLLTDILCLRFGFSGTIVSDWGAVNNRVLGLSAGLHLEMPGNANVNNYEIVNAIENKTLPENALDAACIKIISLAQKYSRSGKEKPPANFESNHALATTALEKSAVLLKNNAMLPLSKTKKLAVIGEFAKNPHYQGGGSSVMNPNKLVSFTTALENSSLHFAYSAGYKNGTYTNKQLLAAAANTAASADDVLLFLGLPALLECEGEDRTHLNLPNAQIKLLNAVKTANNNLTVVLCCGSPVVMPWLEDVKALLYAGLGGEGGGTALLNLIFGKVSPCGKLAESWPLKLHDTPCFNSFPSGPREVSSNESIFCGYRYYDTAKKDVLFPFGFGLSYTNFTYKNLRINKNILNTNEAITTTFTLKNTGEMLGNEITQVYVKHKNSATFQPQHELKHFCCTTLNAGESKEISFKISYDDLRFHYAPSGENVVESGDYILQIGTNSRNLPLEISIHVNGLRLQYPKEYMQASLPYFNIESNNFGNENFAALYGKKLQNNSPVQKGQYTLETTLGELNESFFGRYTLTLSALITKKFVKFSNNPRENKKATKMVAAALPIRNIPVSTSGLISPEATNELLLLYNGKSNVFKVARKLFKRKSYREF